MSAIANWLEQHLLPCPIKAMTGFDCIGCGIQRAFVALLRGEFAESFRIYPALFPILFTFALLAVHLIFRLRNGAAWLKYSYIASTAVAVISYVVKIINLHSH